MQFLFGAESSSGGAGNAESSAELSWSIAQGIPAAFPKLSEVAKAPSKLFVHFSKHFFLFSLFLKFFFFLRERCSFKAAPTCRTESMIKTSHDETHVLNCEIGGESTATVIVSLALCFLKAGRR